MKQVLLIILTAFITNTALAQWQLQAEYPEGTKNFKEIFFSDENNGWIADETGPYLYTTDGGENWFENAAGDLANDIIFFDLDTGIRCYAGRIYKTVNNGEDWTVVCDNWSNITDLSFADNKNGWAVWDVDFGCFISSDDYGNTWQSNYVFTDMIYFELYTLDLVARDTGWVYLRRVDSEFNQYWEIYKTENGGNTWILKCQPSIILRKDMFFINDSTGWLCGGSSFGYNLLHTYNDGQTWMNQELIGGENIDRATCIHFANDTIGWLGTDNYESPIDSGFIYYTTNAGINWNKQADYDSPIEDIFMLNKNKGWAVGKHRIYKYNGSNSVKEILGDEFSISIYPNPSKGIFTVKNSSSGIQNIHNIKISDITGKRINIRYTISNDQILVDISDHPAGIYIISLSGNDYKISKKIMLSD